MKGSISVVVVVLPALMASVPLLDGFDTGKFAHAHFL